MLHRLQKRLNSSLPNLIQTRGQMRTQRSSSAPSHYMKHFCFFSVGLVRVRQDSTRWPLAKISPVSHITDIPERHLSSFFLYLFNNCLSLYLHPQKPLSKTHCFITALSLTLSLFCFLLLLCWIIFWPFFFLIHFLDLTCAAVLSCVDERIR